MHSPHSKNVSTIRGNRENAGTSDSFALNGKNKGLLQPDTQKYSLTPWTIRIIAIVFWILVWQIAAMAINQDIILVSPIQAIQTLFGFLQLRDFWMSVGLSLLRIFMGGALAFVLGILLAFLSFKNVVIRYLLEPLISTIKSIPVASFVILLLVWIRTPYLSISISFLMALPILYVAVLEGLLAIDQQLIEMADVYHIFGWRRIKAIYLSQLLPSLKAATSLAMGFCWKSGIAAEVIGLPSFSIGEHLFNAKIYLDIPALFAWTLVVIALSALGEKLVLFLVSWVTKKLEKSCA